jgi:hypothetical protein
MPLLRSVLACTATLVVLLVGASPAAASASGVRAWLTTGDRSSLLAEQSPDAVGAADPSAASG